MRHYLWPLIAVLVILIFLYRDRLVGNNDGLASPAAGKQLEEITIEPLTPQARPLSENDLRGKVTIINFWGYWCGPCVVEFPHLARLGDEFRANGQFQMIFVAGHMFADPDKTEILRTQTMKFLANQGRDQPSREIPIHFDPTGNTRLRVAQAAGTEWIGYPTTLLIRPDGVIHGMWVGYSPNVIAQLRRETVKLLESQ